MKHQKIDIYFYNQSLGNLFVDNINGKDVYSFEYDAQWLKSNKYLSLDPEIAPYTGRQYPSEATKLFGCFSDCSPDRWGKMLIRRREQQNAIKNNHKLQNLREIDYLLKVSDYGRPGAFRFSLNNGESFVSDEVPDIPPIKFIRELQDASLNFVEDDAALDLLLAPGSSLGGARPKASVKDTDGSLWIAKFPAKQDNIDVGAWEMVVHDLAEMVGINISQAKLLRLSNYGSTFLAKRFDRKKDQRIHFASAMTMLNKTDGNGAIEGVSYLDMASWIMANCHNVKENLHELYNRVVFNCAVSNCDDHLRNHAFLLKSTNWELSPAYDINPDSYGNMLSLNITENSNIISRDNLIDASKYYDLTEEEAKQRIAKITNVVNKNWNLLAKKYKISSSSIEYMHNCFKK